MIVFACFLSAFTSANYLVSQSEPAAGIFEKNKASVITFFILDENKSELSRGSGFIIGKDLMVTNFHLVSQAKSAEGLDSRGKKVKVEGIISLLKDYDLALVKVKSKAPPLPSGKFDSVMTGNALYVIGGNEIGELKIYEGKVSSVVEYTTNKKVADLDISAPGSLSGGPVFDASGQFVGMLFSPEGYVKFVLPAEVISEVSKTGVVTKFKKWNPVEYYKTQEGVNLAAQVFAATENHSRAAKYLKEVINFSPDDMNAQMLLASIYANQRNYSSAVSAYQKIVEKNPNLDKAYLGIGMVYVKMMKWQDAVAPLEKAIQLNAENTEAFSFLGKAYQEQRKFDKAAVAYKQYIEKDSEAPIETFVSLGECYSELNRHEDAILSFQKVAEKNPADLNINYKLAQSYQKAGQLEKADEIYTRLAQLSPEEAKIYFNTIIRMYDDAKMPDKAVEAANKLIALDPNNHESVYNLGAMLVKMQKFQEAAETFEKAIELNPSFEYAYANLGYCYSQLKNYKEAVAAFQKLTEIAPDNSDGHFNLAINYMQQKKWSGAVDPLNKTIELRPENGLAYYNLAITYLNLKDNYSAREVYNKLKGIDPNLASKLQKYLR